MEMEYFAPPPSTTIPDSDMGNYLTSLCKDKTNYLLRAKHYQLTTISETDTIEDCNIEKGYRNEVAFLARDLIRVKNDLVETIVEYNNKIYEGLISDRAILIPPDKNHSGQHLINLLDKLRIWIRFCGKVLDNRAEMQELIKFSAVNELSHGEIRSLLGLYYGSTVKYLLLCTAKKPLEDAIAAIATRYNTKIDIITTADLTEKLTNEFNQVLQHTLRYNHVKFNYLDMMTERTKRTKTNQRPPTSITQWPQTSPQNGVQPSE